MGLSGRRWLLQKVLPCLAMLVAAVPVRAGPSHVLVLGRISDDPASHYAQLQPLLDYVVPRMREVGISEGRILMARDAQQMGSYLRRGQVDWVTETAGTAVALGLRSGAQPLLLTERGGVRDYHTVFFVRRDSPIRTLEDLRGHTLALQNANSTSAYLVPVMTLLQHGVTPEILSSVGDQAAPDTVGYVFARTELNIATFVHKGVVDAGAVSNRDWSDGKRIPPGFIRDFRPIHRTEPYPRAVEMVRAGLPAAVRDRLQQVLLEAATDPQAQDALQEFFGTSGFHRVDAQMQHRLDELKQGLKRVRMEVE